MLKAPTSPSTVLSSGTKPTPESMIFLVVIPNSELFTNRVVVNTRHESVRHQVDITVPNTYSLEPIREAVDAVSARLGRRLDGLAATAGPAALAGIGAAPAPVSRERGEDLRGGPTRCDASVQRPFQR